MRFREGRKKYWEANHNQTGGGNDDAFGDIDWEGYLQKRRGQ